MGHFVIVGILVVVMAVLTYLGLDAAGLADRMNPIVASAQAVPIDRLWHWEVMVICFLFALIIVPMGYSLIVFRQKKGELLDGEHMEGNANLEIAWTVLPLITVMVFAYFGAYSLGEIRRVDPDALVVNVRAQQFNWSFEYPEYGFISDELHLPVDRQAVLKMESADVIHSFWVPEFRLKQDVVPGRVTEYRVTPILEGSYKVRCAELCGTSHAYMENAVVVNNQTEYDAWVVEQQALFAAAQTPEGKGELLAKTKCVACHSIDGTKIVGPTWLGLFGSDVALADGSNVPADEAFLLESIMDPNAKIVKDYQPNVMPSAEALGLTDEDVANLIAYIKTLK